MTISIVFFFNVTAPPEIYTLSLPAALPCSVSRFPRAPADRAGPPSSWPRPGGTPRCEPRTRGPARSTAGRRERNRRTAAAHARNPSRTEEHTSEHKSQPEHVCRLLLEKKKNKDDQGNILEIFIKPQEEKNDIVHPPANAKDAVRPIKKHVNFLEFPNIIMGGQNITLGD